MDKEAQLEIRRILDSMFLVQKTGIEVPLNHYAWDILDTLGKLGYRKLPKDKPPLLNEIKIEGYFENELRWKYEHLASDVEALVPEKLRDNVRWVIHELFGREIIEAQREADIKHYEEVAERREDDG